MKQFFLDTNVVLDFMLRREPHATFAQALFAAAEAGVVTLYAASLSFSTIFYVARKELGRAETLRRIQDMLSRCTVLGVDAAIVQQAATASDFKDFEDGLQYFCALQSAVQAIVTRNGKDFKASAIPVMSPQEAAASLL